MHKQFPKKYGMMLLFALFLFLNSPVGFAESLDTFDAIIHPPENQKDKSLLYYDLQLAPNQQEKLMVTLVNKSKEAIDIRASFNRAITNSVGVIEYSGLNKDTSASVPNNIEELVTLGTASVTLEPNQTKDIYLTVQMPQNAFKGVLAGGLYLEQVPTGKVEGNIRNIFSREIAVLLRNETTPVQPELNIQKAYATQKNYRNMIELQIENAQPTYVKNVAVTYNVLLDDDKTVLEGKKERMSIAPNTVFPFQIPLSGAEFASGKYTVQAKVTSDDQEWTGTPSFTVNQETAQQYNDNDVTIDKSAFAFPSWSTLAVLVTLLLLAIVVIFLILRNRKLKKNLTEN